METTNPIAQAINQLNTKYLNKKNGLPLILLPDDYYFVERTLVELGLLPTNKNQVAHHALIQLLQEGGHVFHTGVPTNRHLQTGKNCITDAPYPWQVADNPIGRDYADDLDRRRLIYRVLKKLLDSKKMQCQ